MRNLLKELQQEYCFGEDAPLICDEHGVLLPKQVADLLGHSTSQITEMHYVKKDSTRLNGITDGFEI